MSVPIHQSVSYPAHSGANQPGHREPRTGGGPAQFEGLTLSQINEATQRMECAERVLAELVGHRRSLNEMGHSEVSTFADLARAVDVHELVMHPARITASELAAEHFLAETAGSYLRAKGRAEELAAQKAELAKVFVLDKPIPFSDIAALQQAIKKHAGSPLRLLYRPYRVARKQAKLFLRPGLRISPTSLARSMLDLNECMAGINAFESDEKLKAQLGTAFRGFETNWSRFEMLLRWAKTAQSKGVGYENARMMLAQRDSQPSPPSPTALKNLMKNLDAEIGTARIHEILGITAPVTSSLTTIPELQARLAALGEHLREVQHLGRVFGFTQEKPALDVLKGARAIVAAVDFRDLIRDNPNYREITPEARSCPEIQAAALRSMLKYTGALAKLGLPDAVARWCFQSEVAERLKKLHEFLHQVKFAIGRWKDLRRKVDRFGATAPNLLSLGRDTDDPACAKEIGRLRTTLAGLPQLVALNRAICAAGDLGLQRWVDAVIAGDIPADQAAATFDRTVHERLAENLIRKNPCLADFSRLGIEDCRERFRKLDREIMQQAPLWAAASCATREVVRGISTGRVAELTEMGLIRREIQKQKRFCRIRDLVRRAGLSLQAMKPCFMMSPLSVAQFLPAGGFQFDLVIMDEASQVKPEDALGAAARAKQLVVVGDRNQLPPTSFFDRLGDDETPEEIETFLDNSESILDVAAKSFPSRRLKWHYRSQHESLITFSNERFYDGELVVFPSPTRDAGTLGVHFHFVDSGRFTGGCNPVEADIVARAVVEQAKSGTNESVGVGTLNAEQQSAIEDRLDAICSQDAEAIAAIQRLRDHADPLFVKNLENLQGDERDIIFISCTYGPDPLTGKVFNRFGPMNGAQGWRRLNVLITRARRRVEVFSSMRPGDIHASLESDTDSDRRSLSSLRGYLEFAETGKIRDPGTDTGRGADSMFEIAVARVVRTTGLDVVAQVGVAGFFIDMGVLKPGSTDEFLFGIECDGATYHSSKSARDRDRLREEIIVACGWRLYRIWSTDWFTNQHAEEERLRRFIRTLI